MAGARDQSATTRSQRVHEVRRVNYEEAPPDFRVVAHNQFAAADMTAEGSATWGDKIQVEGFERLHLFLDHTAGTATTDVHVAMQASPNGADWYDVYSDEADDGVLVRKVFDWTTAVDGAIAFADVPRVGRFMRFKTWADGANRANSRATLYAKRVMDAM